MHRYHTALLFLVWLVFSIDMRADEASWYSTTDKARIQGTWRAVNTTNDGRPNPDARGTLFTFLGDTLTIKNKRLKQDVHATFKLDETKTPKEIDWSGQFMGKTFVVRAIYKFDDESLVYCAAQHLDPNSAPAPRPKEFKTVAGDGRTLSTISRVREQGKEP